MAEESDRSDLQAEFDQLDTTFAEFHKFRGEHGIWDDLIRRRSDVVLPEDISSKQYFSYLSPDAEKNLGDTEDVLEMNPTSIDAFTMDTSVAGRQAERDITMYLNRMWASMNEGRWYDRAVGEGQTRHGAKVIRLCYYPQDEKFNYGKVPVYLENTQIDGTRWLEKERDTETFYYKYSVPVVGSDLFNEDRSQKITLDSASKIAWIGSSMPHDTSIASKKLQVIVRDARDPARDHCVLEDCDCTPRIISVFVTRENGKLSDPDAQHIVTVPSPFDRCSFFIIGGRVSHAETNPHLKYRPLLYPLFAEMQFHNYLVTVLSTMTVQDYSDDGLTLNTAKWRANFPGVPIPEAGEPKTFELPKDGQVVVAPGEFERLPRQISAHIIQLIELSKDRMTEYRLSRFVSGAAYAETAQATTTAFELSLQQASLPFNHMLGQSDVAIKNILMASMHAIRVWLKDTPDEADVAYKAVSTGEENARFAKQQRGKLASINKKTASYPFDLIINTQNLTKAEQGAAATQAIFLYKEGFYDEEDVMRAVGIKDIQGQFEKLARSRVRRKLQPAADSITQFKLLTEAELRSGIPFAQMMGGPPPSTNTPAAPPPGQTGGASGSVPNNIVGNTDASRAGASIQGGSSPI